MESKKTSTVKIYEGEGRFTFVNVTIWEAILFIVMTKLTGGSNKNKVEHS